MLKPVTNITITQVVDYTDELKKVTKRNKVIKFDFCNHWEVQNGWENMTTNGKLVLPKNVYVNDLATKKLFPLFGKNKNIGGFNSAPLLMRGDKIKIEAHYIYWDDNLNQKETPSHNVIEGYITKVKTGMPIEIEFEDSMFLLKQIPMQNQAIPLGTNIESVLQNALINTEITVNILTNTTFSFDNALLTIENETVAQFLAKLKKDHNCYAYFKGTELRVGSYVYIESEAKEKTFKFQENIISSELDYNRKDDIVLSAKASNHIQEVTNKMTKDGHLKTKNVRIEVLCTIKNNIESYKVIGKGDTVDPNIEGERKDFVFLDAKTPAQLAEKAFNNLRLYYYDGYKGSFTTFGTPVVELGDNARIINDILPEQNGIYKIKQVDTEGGIGGMRQKITLDYRIKKL